MEWISVKDKLPGEHDDIFVSILDKDRSKRYYGWWKGYILIDDVKSEDTSVDYWMPVPKIKRNKNSND